VGDPDNTWKSPPLVSWTHVLVRRSVRSCHFSRRKSVQIDMRRDMELVLTIARRIYESRADLLSGSENFSVLTESIWVLSLAPVVGVVGLF
jgi:hypothetical protein